ncbi:hypothetical protein NMG60_11030879 [Bertholletia excelsa]
MSSEYFPLRWESTGDQWWYAAPIDCAAANGHYDLVRELLRLDPNLLIKLTSLRRLRRLETVWDDETRFAGAASCRSAVARRLLLDSDADRGYNSLIRAGYGGWLLYSAAAAGDAAFVGEILARDPLLVFGEGEYGVTDILYAAARSKSSEVFRILLNFAISQKCFHGGSEDEMPVLFRWEMMNRAVHAAARGGNVEVLGEILGESSSDSDVLAFRDAQGSTVLHTAAGRGQVEVVKHLLSSYDIISSNDDQGNTAMHMAAYRAYLAVVELLISSSPSCISLTNNYGDTFLHMAVAGFRSPGFRRLDRQMELMKHLVSGKIVNLADIVNMRNCEGRTALHMAVAETVHSDLVELLMTVHSIDLNTLDDEGMTPLDLLKQRPQTPCSEMLIKRLISAGGISSCHDEKARSVLASHLKMQGIGSSPGASFRIPDAEIVLYTGFDQYPNCYPASTEYSSCSSELSNFSSASNSLSYAARRLRTLLRWPRRKERKPSGDEDDGSPESLRFCKNMEESLNPIPLRQRYSKQCSLPNNKRVLSRNNELPSASERRKFATSLMHGVIRAGPYLAVQSPTSPFSDSSSSSPTQQFNESLTSYISSTDLGNEGEESLGTNRYSLNSGKLQKRGTFNGKVMNQYFCFGAEGLAVEDSVTRMRRPGKNYKRSASSMA